MYSQVCLEDIHNFSKCILAQPLAGVLNFEITIEGAREYTFWIHRPQPCFSALTFIKAIGIPPAWATNKSIFVQKGHVIHHFYELFQADFNNVIIEMIARPKIEGSQS